jgi:hypothetical protein
MICDDKAGGVVLLGNQLTAFNGQVVIGKQNSPDDTCGMIFAFNGVNYLTLPKNTVQVAQFNCGLNVKGKLTATSIDGTVSVATTAKNYDTKEGSILTKFNELDKNKLNVVTGSSTNERVYGIAANGTQETIYTTSSILENALVKRDSQGRFEVASPETDLQCANKKYVDLRLTAMNGAVSFVDYQAMIEFLNPLAKDKYGVNQNIMIITLNVPDLWISEVLDEPVEYEYSTDEDFIQDLNTNGSVQVGYFKLSALETQKVTLNEYVKFTDVASTSKAGIAKINAYNGIIDSGGLSISAANKYCFDSRSPFNLDGANDISKFPSQTNSKPIVVNTIDYAVKRVLVDNKLEAALEGKYAWTDEDKTAACNTIGALKAITTSNGAGVNTYQIQAFNNNDKKYTILTLGNYNVTGKFTIPMRDKDGHIFAPDYDPEKAYTNVNKIVVNKKYIDDAVANCVQIRTDVTDYPFVYVKNAAGEQGTLEATQTAKARTIVYRDGNGRFNVGVPASDYHCANKKYVDESINSVVGDINSLLESILGV